MIFKSWIGLKCRRILDTIYGSHQIQKHPMKSISRRKMLGKTSLLGAAVTVGMPLAKAASESTAKMPMAGAKLKVVVTGGHPGDPEYGCGGTIARYADLGQDVVLLYLNRGDWSDRPGYDPSPVRVAEATKACEILKARPLFAAQHDGKAIIDQPHYEEFHQLLASEQP